MALAGAIVAAENIGGAHAAKIAAFMAAIEAELSYEHLAYERTMHEHIEFGRCRYCDPLFFFHLTND